MEDFLGLEEFLELEDGENLEDLDSSRERPHICTEEASGICKRVKRIHDPVKIVVPCAEVEFPIPPDISM
ncbi:hypothetical protein HID58_060026 [Brassica napus]|uniref:Uncharacterized protein n=1 Tax=Brassica napus TaxID=3708 RepID=A0ABQ7ZVL1_BRANA|nr:hypothetical protein HID58_060026 [Brassica napus]